MLGKTTYLRNFVKIKGKSIFPPCAERKLIATLLRASGIEAKILEEIVAESPLGRPNRERLWTRKYLSILIDVNTRR